MSFLILFLFFFGGGGRLLKGGGWRDGEEKENFQSLICGSGLVSSCIAKR